MSKGFEGTKGPWFAKRHGAVVGGQSHQYTNGEAMGQIAMACVPVHSTAADPVAERDANTRLIAEAGTVLHETGLTPRQLAEQRAELLEALNRAADTVERDDLDTPICCDGRECGCMGSSNRQLFVHDLRALAERIANATQQRNATGGEG